MNLTCKYDLDLWASTFDIVQYLDDNLTQIHREVPMYRIRQKLSEIWKPSESRSKMQIGRIRRRWLVGNKFHRNVTLVCIVVERNYYSEAIDADFQRQFSGTWWGRTYRYQKPEFSYRTHGSSFFTISINFLSICKLFKSEIHFSHR